MILQEQVSRYANEHVLVLGGRRDEIRQVAELFVNHYVVAPLL